MLNNEHGFVGYRVREQFIGLPAPDDAVGRTRGVTGSLEIGDGELRRAEIDADMSNLKSDQPPRDEQLRSAGPETGSYPKARFHLQQPIALPDPAVGKIWHVAARGELTIHGVTQAVTFPLDARWTGRLFQVAGHLRITLADYKMSISPQMGMNVSKYGTVEVQLDFAKAGTAPPPPKNAQASGHPNLEPAANDVGSIIFSVQKSDHVSLLYRAATDGSELHQVTRKPSTFGVADRQAHASSDGTQIVFVHQALGEESEPPPSHLFVVNADGSGLKRLTDSPQSESYPSYSPDGREIAFVRAAENGTTLLVIVAADGGGERILKTPKLTVSSPSWSPDGTRLVFVGYNGQQNLYLIGADGKNLRRLTNGDAYDHSPVFAPNGSRIAFGRDGHLLSVDESGARMRAFTHGPYRDASPRYSPDGKWIVFTRANETGATFYTRTRIALVPAAGGQVRRVPLAKLTTYWPAWLGPGE